MKRSHVAALFILVSLLASSCSKIVFSNGEPITEIRPIGNFKAISMFNNVNVKLVQSNQPRLELTCPKNLIDNIVTESSVTGDTLVIKNENSFNWIRSYDYSIDLIVYYDQLREINYASIGNLVCTDSIKGISELNDNGSHTHNFYLSISEGSGNIDLTFDCDQLKTVFVNGTSCVTLRGEAGYSSHATRSYGTIRAENLSSNIVTVQSESTNDVYVWARSSLTVYLHSIGNVYYKGHPYVVVQPNDSKDKVIPLQ